MVVGGGAIGCEVGLHLASKGKKVTIVEMTDKLATELFDDNRTNLVQLLREGGVEVLSRARLIEVTDEGVIVDGEGGRRELKADTVVLALGLKAEVGLLKALEGREPVPIAIGDCVEPRRIINAIWEGFRIGRLI